MMSKEQNPAYDCLDTYSNAAVAEWQTRQVEGLVDKVRVGSTPTRSTNFHLWVTTEGSRSSLTSEVLLCAQPRSVTDWLLY